jgi:RimJ/RimL family protein N-acetyltransferase
MAIEVEHLTDASAFLAVAGERLRADEARHNLMLGVAETAAARPDAYAAGFHAWVARRAGAIAGVVSMTPPFNAIVAAPDDPDALEALADALAGSNVATPGVTGAVPEADAFASALVERLGDREVHVTSDQGIYELTRVGAVPAAPGAPRRATPRDRETVLGWFLAFQEEAMPGEPGGRDRLDPVVDHRLGMRGSPAPPTRSGIWIWEDGGEPVSVAGFDGATGTGIRVGPVYTPPRHRGRGYATSLVAEMSAWLLANGYERCFLYTDLANPTSNAIYRRIGYRQVCGSRMLTFRAGMIPQP